ncbi:hypothetical protein CMK18_21875 [Candidatus Poribacteria bacterium]|nr:hypothetical protein [Candidatus Poribacteria bacterium]
MTDAYDKIANQDYLTGKQLTILSLVIIIVIQSIPLMVNHSPELEWLLLGFTAAVSACAVVGAILVQFNADKMAKVYRGVFNEDFYKTVRLFTQMRHIVKREAEEKGKNVEEELEDVVPKAYAFFRAYLDKENVVPPSLEELGVEPAPEIADEGELFV